MNRPANYDQMPAHLGVGETCQARRQPEILGHAEVGTSSVAGHSARNSAERLPAPRRRPKIPSRVSAGRSKNSGPENGLQRDAG
jgi:hypothetical protein